MMHKCALNVHFRVNHRLNLEASALNMYREAKIGYFTRANTIPNQNGHLNRKPRAK